MFPGAYDIVKGRRKGEPNAVNLPFSFDIETTSFYQNPKTGDAISVPDFFQLEKKNARKAKMYEKRGCLVAWGFGVAGEVYFGRTWEELFEFLKNLKEHFELEAGKRIAPVYIHNLSYEFQWIRKRFNWVSVFATSERQPIRAACDLGLEFRDSLILSGMSLEKTAESLTKHSVGKLVGSWDYHALRGSKTKIEPFEWDYLRNDNLIVMYYIEEMLDQYKSVNKIPMTKTGIVREDVRSYCFWGNKKSHKKDEGHRYIDYSRLMRSLSFGTMLERVFAKLAFAGGFTHANAMNAGLVIENVRSMDETSAYPAAMVSEKYPMGRGEQYEPKSLEDFEKQLTCYCCLIEIELFNVESIFPWEHVISRSKCIEIDGQELDNGRVIRAKRIRIAMTDIDYQCYKRFYRWKSVRIRHLWRYVRGYLPKAICEKVIEYYEGKTTLKDVEGRESEYARLKTMLNSVYGMCVYDEMKPDVIYENGEWKTEEPNREEQLEKYNSSKSRFLSFLWGIWITAYARRNIFSAILEAKEDHQYSDTDSEKMTNYEKHEKFFKWYNANITIKIHKCMQYHGIDPKRANPKDIYGISHPLGHFVEDGNYARFCTLGAKRYAVDKGSDYPEEKRYSLTISGVNKKKAVPAIQEKMKENQKDFFDYFHFGMIYDRETCGKLLHTYIDEAVEGSFKDKDGIVNYYREESFVHLEETTYEMSADDEYFSLLNHYNSIAYID